MNNPKNQIQITAKQQIQITDLLAEAVANATERRELAGMTELSGEESQDINGGVGVNPIICGRIPCGFVAQLDS